MLALYMPYRPAGMVAVICSTMDVAGEGLSESHHCSQPCTSIPMWSNTIPSASSRTGKPRPNLCHTLRCTHPLKFLLPLHVLTPKMPKPINRGQAPCMMTGQKIKFSNLSSIILSRFIAAGAPSGCGRYLVRRRKSRCPCSNVRCSKNPL